MELMKAAMFIYRKTVTAQQQFLFVLYRSTLILLTIPYRRKLRSTKRIFTLLERDLIIAEVDRNFIEFLQNNFSKQQPIVFGMNYQGIYIGENFAA